MKNPKIEKIIIVYVWIYTLIVSLSLFFIFHFDYLMAISFALGSATSLLCFTMTVKTVDKALRYDDERKKSLFIKNNIYKYLVYLAVLAVAGYSYYLHKNDPDKTRYLNVFAVAGGFFSVRIMIYFKMLIVDKIFKNKTKDDYHDEVVTEEEHEKLEQMRKELDEEEKSKEDETIKNNKYLRKLNNDYNKEEGDEAHDS